MRDKLPIKHNKEQVTTGTKSSPPFCVWGMNFHGSWKQNYWSSVQNLSSKELEQHKIYLTKAMHCWEHHHSIRNLEIGTYSLLFTSSSNQWCRSITPQKTLLGWGPKPQGANHACHNQHQVLQSIQTVTWIKPRTVLLTHILAFAQDRVSNWAPWRAKSMNILSTP